MILFFSFHDANNRKLFSLHIIVRFKTKFKYSKGTLKHFYSLILLKLYSQCKLQNYTSIFFVYYYSQWKPFLYSLIMLSFS
jgi:hypothetical protein